MTRKLWQGIIGVLLGSSLLLQLQGCVGLLAAGAGAAAGAGTVSYLEGESKSTYAASFDRAWNATMAALRDADLQVVDAQKDAIKGTIKAKRSDDTSVTLALEQAGPNTTAVKVRVGTFGDEEASKAIHRRIATRLGVAAG